MPLSFRYCLFFPLISNAFHSLSKIILPLVPYGILFISFHFLPEFIIYMIIDFYYFVNVYYRVANCTINHIILSSIFVYIYILKYRLLSCIIYLTTKQKAVAPSKSKPPPIKKKKGRLIIHQSKVKINEKNKQQGSKGSS